MIGTKKDILKRTKKMILTACERKANKEIKDNEALLLLRLFTALLQEYKEAIIIEQYAKTNNIKFNKAKNAIYSKMIESTKGV